MQQIFTIKKGSNNKRLTITVGHVVDNVFVPVSLADATSVKMSMRVANKSQRKIDARSCTIASDQVTNIGQLSVLLTSADCDTLAEYIADIEVTRNDGSVEMYPDDNRSELNYIKIIVTDRA